MIKFMVAGTFLVIASLILGQILLFVRFKKEKDEGRFSGNFYNFRLEKLVKTRPGQKPGFNSQYETPTKEVIILLSFFAAGLFIIINFVV